MKLCQMESSGAKSKRYQFSVILIHCVIFFICLIYVPALSFAEIKTGGLTAYPYASVGLGPNLLTNPSFEVIDTGTGKPSGWASLGFTLDSTVAHTGSKSYRVKDANLTSGSEYVQQTVSLKKGTYRISAWVKLYKVDGGSGKGVRLALRPSYNQVGGAGITPTINGTSDWRYLEARNIIITQDTTAKFRIETYQNPTGTAWFDDVVLQEELPLPIEVFCLYPNYRGMLFGDQSQIARFNIKTNPPAGTNVSDYYIHIMATDETTSSVVIQSTLYPSQKPEGDEATLNCTSFINDRTYLVKFFLTKKSGNATVYEHPAYRISKLAGTNRSSMTMSFDKYNRFLVRGKPTFILGVYDSGMAYTDDETLWETQQFGTWRRLFEIPINLYLNYTYALAPVSAMTSMMNVLQRHGVLYLQSGQANQWRLSSALITTDDSYATALASHTGFAGVYTMDEAYAQLAPAVFESNLRLKNLDPDGVTFAAASRILELPYWREVVDILSTDPYPLYGAEPSQGYPLNKVAAWTRECNNVLKSSRPFCTVIQFFQSTSNSRWPTTGELRNMSYMAIAEGANGLFYWSLGNSALAVTCSPSTSWCPTKEDYFGRLKSVMNELNGLNPALTSIDTPNYLVGNNNPSAVRTRVKYANGKGYLIAYNYTNTPTGATFTWRRAPSNIEVYNESRTITPSGSSFSDTFGKYEAHVYVISE
ncbi:MAG TPA: carbohydrate binding domain-containing protein [Candidatus Hypogeohydataceae bacterium YC41]